MNSAISTQIPSAGAQRPRKSVHERSSAARPPDPSVIAAGIASEKPTAIAIPGRMQSRAPRATSGTSTSAVRPSAPSRAATAAHAAAGPRASPSTSGTSAACASAMPASRIATATTTAYAIGSARRRASSDAGPPPSCASLPSCCSRAPRSSGDAPCTSCEGGALASPSPIALMPASPNSTVPAISRFAGISASAQVRTSATKRLR